MTAFVASQSEENRRGGWHRDWIEPDWPVPPGVRALVTTRSGGWSRGPFGAPGDAGGLNLGLGLGQGQAADDPAIVRRNRDRVRQALPGMPLWLRQVHGTRVVDAGHFGDGAACVPPEADAVFATAEAVVCCVLVADCLPVLLAEAQGGGVAAAHAGWRGLAGGVIQNAVAALRNGLGNPHARLLAYLGPAIGPEHFVVGAEVLGEMLRHLPRAAEAFVPAGPAKFRADLFALARQALEQAGVHEVFGGGICTVSDPERFYSHRRDRITGRHAAFIWRASPEAGATSRR